MEVDAGLAAAARTALTTAVAASGGTARGGATPTVITGDATFGWPPSAPYDRIIATYAVHTVPYAWVRQTAPGGIIVLPWVAGLCNGVLIRLTVHDGGTAAEGRVIGDSAFMWDRNQRPDRDVMATVRNQSRAGASRTALDPRRVLGDENMAFTAGVLVPHTRYSVGHGPDGEFALWLADTTTGSWAGVDYAPDAPDYPVDQYGPRSLWNEVTTAYAWWRENGSRNVPATA